MFGSYCPQWIIVSVAVPMRLNPRWLPTEL